jgi:hypothetical protein
MKTVLIDASGQVFNTDRVVKVSKNGNEDVRWVAMSNGGPWAITFDKILPPSTYPVGPGSPFDKTEYTVPKAGSGSSTGGPIAGLVGWTYKYNIRDDSGAITDDPDVDIES